MILQGLLSYYHIHNPSWPPWLHDKKRTGSLLVWWYMVVVYGIFICHFSKNTNFFRRHIQELIMSRPNGHDNVGKSTHVSLNCHLTVNYVDRKALIAVVLFAHSHSLSFRIRSNSITCIQLSILFVHWTGWQFIRRRLIFRGNVRISFKIDIRKPGESIIIECTHSQAIL